eukprot:scaffold1460_cov73-Cyclotella_meneghiniana.AAC.12
MDNLSFHLHQVHHQLWGQLFGKPHGAYNASAATARGYLPMKNHLGLPCHVKTWDWKIIIISK